MVTFILQLRNSEKLRNFTEYTQQITEGSRIHTQGIRHQSLCWILNREMNKVRKYQSLLLSCSQPKGGDNHVNRFEKLCSDEKRTMSVRGGSGNSAMREWLGKAFQRIRLWSDAQRRSWLCWQSNAVTYKCEKMFHNWELQMAQCCLSV